MIASCQDPLCGSGRGVQHYSSSVPAAGAGTCAMISMA